MSWFNSAPSNPPPSLPPRGPSSQQPGYASVPTQPRPQPSAAPPRQARPQPPGQYAYGDEKQYAPPRQAQQGGGGGGGGRRGGGRFQVVEAPSAGHALTNCLIVNEQDWGGVQYVVVKGKYIYTTR